MVYSNWPVVVTGRAEQRQVHSQHNCHFGPCNYCCRQTHLGAGNLWITDLRQGDEVNITWVWNQEVKSHCCRDTLVYTGLSCQPVCPQLMLYDCKEWWWWSLYNLPRIGNVHPEQQLLWKSMNSWKTRAKISFRYSHLLTADASTCSSVK